MVDLVFFTPGDIHVMQTKNSAQIHTYNIIQFIFCVNVHLSICVCLQAGCIRVYMFVYLSVVFIKIMEEL